MWSAEAWFLMCRHPLRLLPTQPRSRGYRRTAHGAGLDALKDIPGWWASTAGLNYELNWALGTRRPVDQVLGAGGTRLRRGSFSFHRSPDQ